MSSSQPVIPPECLPGAPDGDLSDQEGGVVPGWKWSEWLTDHVYPSAPARESSDDRPRVLHVLLSYPKQRGNFDRVQMDLEDVREADPIRISYDFDRDGWVIQQQNQIQVTRPSPSSRVEWVRGDWSEVAFVESWALTIKENAP